MEQSKRTPRPDARVHGLNFTFVDCLTLLVILVGIVLIKPQFDKILQPAQADSPASKSVEAKQAPAPQAPTESDTLLLAKAASKG